MDVTVTAPLDMGAGQQRYVVAYTLKQGIEKQPDILNAQKSTYFFVDTKIIVALRYWSICRRNILTTFIRMLCMS